MNIGFHGRRILVVLLPGYVAVVVVRLAVLLTFRLDLRRASSELCSA